MTPTIAIIASGAMGSAVGRVLTSHGARVLTLLDGRSAASRARAEACGMQAASVEEIAASDIILSIVPPAEALGLAKHLAAPLRRSPAKPVFVDCNAVNPGTVAAIADVIAQTGAGFVDAGIIGLPPKAAGGGPTFYLCGPDAAPSAAVLAKSGLLVRVMDGPIGAASSLKMSYAGITKGLTALAAMMVLGAARAGALDALVRELADSQPQLLTRFERAVPDMVPKAYRWVAEMREIAAFLDGDKAAAMVFEGVAQLYERLAADAAHNGPEIQALLEFADQAKVPG
jgi:3-hydroxyisobutyrate dehydrogenase-like beta-hydroxyacid dehydrogenase